MRREEGFTIIEVLTAILILSIGIVATLAIFDSSRHLQTTAEHQTTLFQRAEAELERVLALPYSEVALTGTSTSWSSTPTDYTYVNSSGGGGGGGTCGSGAAPAYQPDHSSGGSTATESLVINGCTYTSTSNGQNTTVTPSGGTVAPVTAWSAAALPNNGTIGGNIYDFVTWTADPTCSQSSTAGQYCATTNDYKRVTVVVTQTGANQPTTPAIVSGFVTPPSQGRNPATTIGTLCTVGGVQVSCSSNPCPTCTPTTTTECTGSGCACTGTGCTGCSDTGCTGTETGCGSSCGTGTGAGCGNTSISWLSGAVPVGSSWDVAGTGTASLYLEQSSGSTVTATLCVKVILVPAGALGGVLSQIGTTFTTTVSLSSGVPTPVTFNYSSGLGSAGQVISGLSGTDVEIVTGVSASSSVDILNDTSLGYNNQTTLDLYS